jgi:polyisoprenoid-binding protein YceI
MDAQGKVLLDIDLSSVDSGIEIRDQRLKTIFWNVATHPVVTFVSQIKAADLQKINAAKESVQLTVEGLLSMAGQSKPIQAQLQVTPLNNKLIINTRQAIVVNASDFGLSTGVEALRAIMGLNYLSTSAPVSFQIELVMSDTVPAKLTTVISKPSTVKK